MMNKVIQSRVFMGLLVGFWTAAAVGQGPSPSPSPTIKLAGQLQSGLAPTELRLIAGEYEAHSKYWAKTASDFGAKLYIQEGNHSAEMREFHCTYLPSGNKVCKCEIQKNCFDRIEIGNRNSFLYETCDGVQAIFILKKFAVFNPSTFKMESPVCMETWNSSTL